MTRKITVLSLLCILMLVFSVSMAATQDSEWTCPEGFEGQTLNFINWTTYIAEETIPNFEELCGVRVIQDFFGSSEELLALMRRGNPGYDLMVPSGATMYLMVEEELVQPIDFDNIPNIVNMSEDFIGRSYDPDGIYSVAYQWGTTAVGYNRARVGFEITSWMDVFTYDGPVAWLEDRQLMLGIALMVLGYDPNSDDEGEVAEARQFLIDHGDNVVAIAADNGQEMLLTGEVDIAIEYSGDIFQIIYECECDDFEYVIPVEGANVWVDVLAIPVGAPNKALAEVFIDYILDPHVNAEITNYIAYATPNQAAIDMGLIDEEMLEDPNVYPDDELMERLFFAIVDPVRERLHNAAWDEVTIFIGR